MKKSLIALAALGAFAGAVSAQSSVTLYGIIDLGLVKQNRADGGSPLVPVIPGLASTQTNGGALGGVGMNNKEANINQATKSRIGFRGVEDLGGGLSAKFDLEHRLYPDVGSINTSGGNNFWDKSIVGITSQSFGEVNLGRDYMPAFYLQYLLDPWLNQGIAEVGGTTYAFAGYTPGSAFLTGRPFARSARYNNGLYYKAQGGGFTGIAAVSMKEDVADKNRYGLNLMYNAGPLMLGVAYDRAEEVEGAKSDLVMIGGAYDFGFVKPRILYSRSTLAASFITTPLGAVPTEELNPTSLTISATFPVGTNLVKVGYTQMDWDMEDLLTGDEIKQRKFSIGYEHVLSKRTALYTDLTSGKTKGRETVSGFDIGVRHMF